MPEQFQKKITKSTIIPFSVDQSGLYSISIAADCEKNQDLRIEIDNIKLREIPAEEKPQYMNIPSAWNGTQLRGLSKIVVFILKLNKGERTLTFIPNKESDVNGFKIEQILNPQNIQFNLEIQAEDGDRRPWFTFVLVDLPLESIAADISVKWHFLDGDDVKLIIDNQIKKNPYSVLHRNWIWSAGILKKFFGKEREEKTFTENLYSGIHYIEFWADKTPTLHKVKINLGEIELKRIPTVDDPEWTGNFYDDPDEILMARIILGEMEGQSKAAKIGVAFSVVNRLKKQNINWGLSIKEIILKEYQFDGMWNEKTYDKVRNPLGEVSEKEWQESYKIAVGILSGKILDPTSGATHFYSTSDNTGFPSWAVEEAFRIKIGITYFYELNN